MEISHVFSALRLNRLEENCPVSDSREDAHLAYPISSGVFAIALAVSLNTSREKTAWCSLVVGDKGKTS